MDHSKKLISFILALAVMLAMTPALAFTPNVQAAATPVDNESKLTSAVAGGGEVKLSSDITLANTLEVNSGTVTLDLNGHTLSETAAVITVTGGHLTIKDSSAGMTGMITNNSNSAVKVYGDMTPGHTSAVDSSVRFVSGNIDAQECGIAVFGQGAALYVDGGNISGRDNSAVGGNGTKNASADKGGYYVEINGGTLTGNTTSTGYRNCGLYHPNAGTVIVNGGTIKGSNGAGIVVRGGSLTVNGGTVEGHGTGTTAGGTRYMMGDATATYCGGIEIGYRTGNYSGNGDGTDYPGGIDAIAVNGGTISSDHDLAIHVDGTAAGSAHSQGSTISVTGGAFSTDPSAYVHSGYHVTGTAPYNVSAVPAPAPASGTSTSTTTDGTTASVSTTANGKAAVEGNTANVTVPSDDAAKMISDTAAAEAAAGAAGKSVESSITITAPSSTASANDIKVTLPAATVGKIAADTNAKVTIETAAGQVTLDQKTLDTVAKSSTSGDVTLEIIKLDASALSTDLRDEIGGDAAVYEITLTNSSGKITQLGGTAELLLEIADGNTTPACVYKDDSGSYVLMPSEVVTLNGKRYLKVKTTHFSCYAVVTAAAAGKAVSDTQAKKLAASTVKGLRASAVKGAAVLKWTKVSGLKYKVYKYAGGKYKCVKILSANTYRDKTVKAGKLCRYKVRGYKKISGKTVYTKYASVKIRAK